MGPYPLPTSYREPHPLSEGIWAPFAERLVRDEFDTVLDLLKNNQNILDVGSGYGKLPIAIAERGDEDIPFPDGKFDAVVAMWAMHYVDDLDKSLREMPRVTDITNPNARLVVVQGAPDNKIVNLLNYFCVPLSAENTRIDHQGYLLHTAAKIFSEYGFGKIETFRVNAFSAFPEEDMEERCQKAADILVGFWSKENTNYEQMRTALIPQLKLHFKDRPHAIGDEVAILSARRFPN